MALNKDASPLLAIGRVAGTLGVKALGTLGKATRLGGKAAWKGGKSAKNIFGWGGIAGMAFTPSIAGDYLNTARRQGIGTMKRRMPKFASEGEVFMDGFIERQTMMTTSKYPAFLYKIDGFEKMAEDTAIAHGVVKKAFKFKLPNLLKPQLKHRTPFHEFIKDTKMHEARLGKDWNVIKKRPITAGEAIRGTGRQTASGSVMMGQEEQGKILRKLYDAIQEEHPKRRFSEALRESVMGMPPGAIIATGLVGAAPAAIMAEKVIGNKMERGRMDRSYRDMLRIYPDLKREKQDDVKRYFDYISMYSPTVAKNPHAAGSIIQRFVRGGSSLMDHSIIEGLLKVEKTKMQTYNPKSTGSTISNIAKQLGTATI